MKYLLDTSICVFLLRNEHDIDKRLLEAGIENCSISEITVAELLYGAECSKQKKKNLQLVKEFCADLEVVKIGPVLEYYASKKALLRKEGRMIEDFDLLIGACAYVNGYTLVTDNLKHFERLEGLKVENWVVR